MKIKILKKVGIIGGPTTLYYKIIEIDEADKEKLYPGSEIVDDTTQLTSDWMEEQ